MNLREIAEQDLALTLEDSENGFGLPSTVTDTAGNTAGISVQSGDVHVLYDPDTDVKVSNRTAHISIRISSLTAAGLEIPKAQPDQSKNPYTFEFADSNGVSRKFIVSESRPDRTLGIITVILELIKE